MLKKLFQRPEEQPEGETARIERLLAEGDLAGAEAELRSRLERYPVNLGARLRLAELYEMRDGPEAAVDEYMRVVDGYLAKDLFDKALGLLRRWEEKAPAAEVVERRRSVEQEQRTRGLRERLVQALEQRPEGAVREESLDAALLRETWGRWCGSPLVEALGEDQLARLLAAADVQRWTPGSTLVRAGQTLPRCWWLLAGMVEVLGPPDGTDEVRHRFGPGDLFGDRALFEGRAWRSTLRAGEPSIGLRFNKPAVERALLGNPDPRGLIDPLRRYGGDDRIG